MSRHALLVLAAFVPLAAREAPARAAAQSPPGPTTVEAFAHAFVSAVRARDVDRWTELVADDVVMMAPGGRVVDGRRAFHDLWSRSFQGRSGPNPLRVDLLEIRKSEPLAAVRADYGPEGAGPVGQYVWVLERDEAGAWQLAWWIFTRRSDGG